MADHPDDPQGPVDPFPTDFPEPPPSRFPPVEINGQAPVDASDPPSDWNARADAHDMPVETERPSRLKVLGQLAFPPPPPADEEALAARDRRWTSRVIVVVAVLMLVFNGASIQNWARQQAPNWFTVTVQQVADVWMAQVSQLGADRPRQGIRDAYKDAHDARFPGQDPA
ncbi:MAG: hypothetical protein Q8S53_15185 [Brevundimonas sp.]|uniref:hypothetical protein n=1 Tax=Brevundimonas sp. TaxID=1871086 RepID=UPI0027361C16|nr:hypothetical protein [Brevundimonas sp.]MDP3379707.1 hypothetical protein [Brevundimonas sp.]